MKNKDTNFKKKHNEKFLMLSHCENCEQSKKVIKISLAKTKNALNFHNKLKDLNEAKLKIGEFQNIAKKIVQTDLILRKYSEKETECDKLSDELDKLNR